MTDAHEWISNANEVISLFLVGHDGSARLEKGFHPAFTHTIFGQEEKILGYRDLTVTINLRAHDLTLSVVVRYDEKLDIGHVALATDLEELLSNELPSYVRIGETLPPLSDDLSAWKPPGRLMHGYEHEGAKYEVWCASLSDSRAVEIFEAGQLLIPLFIDGGTRQQLNDPPWTMERWTVFFLYEIRPADGQCPFIFAGYATSYRFWLHTPDNNPQSFQESLQNDALLDPVNGFNPLHVRSRERISQFLIIPPYQGQSHGSRLYQTIMDQYLKDENVFEVTTEDSSEKYDEMRDRCDLTRLKKTSSPFSALALTSKAADKLMQLDSVASMDEFIDQPNVEEIRMANKIFPRQFARLVEMHLLDQLVSATTAAFDGRLESSPSSKGGRQFFYWSLMVKKRLFVHNRDALLQVGPNEQKVMLDVTLRDVQRHYEQLLEMASRTMAAAGTTGKTHPKLASHKRRRRLIDDDDDDDDENDDNGVSDRMELDAESHGVKRR